ncbi:MAG: S8 family serine peptidase [Bacteroidetes bacterium]|nr:S8 family serine peptidase [Bacteroidota bacterium]
MRRTLIFIILLWALGYVPASAQQPDSDKLQVLIEQLNVKDMARKTRVDAYLQATGLNLRQEEAGRVWQLVEVQDGKPFYFITHNLGAATAHKANQVWPGGSTGFNLNGSGVNLGIWDEGKVRHTHQEFFDGSSSRVTQVDGATSLSNHATHVAGTLAAAGTDANAKGMSFAAQLKAYDWNSDETEMATAAAGGLRVSQHSYGYVTGWAQGTFSGNSGWHWFGDAVVSASEDYYWGFYSDQAHDWDQIAHNAPYYLIVKSAGNDRGEGPAPAAPHYFMDPSMGYTWQSSTATRSLDGGTSGYDCISHSAVAKNLLTVGAVTSAGAMSTFSGWGPTDDGRIKPDIVAKGVNVYSSTASSNTSYAYYNGTSMAGPVVSGAVGLLLQHQENLHPGTPLRAATLKGLLIHTADDMVSGAPGPDYRFGWGMLDVKKAAELMQANAGNNAHIRELTLNNSQTIRIPLQATGSEPLRITCSWTDLPGNPPAASLNPTTSMLVNDLDIRLTDAFGNQHFPYILNPASPAAAATTGDNSRDNVEMIHLSSPPAGTIYMLTVSHKGTLTGGSQAFSLIISGNQALDEKTILGAADQASNYTSWTHGSNQGDGFGAWEFENANAPGGYSGFYIGNPADAGISGMSSTAFGLYANPDNPGNYARADRKFASPLPVGATFSLKWGVNWDSEGIGNKGLSLFSNGTEIININMGGSALITINGSPMFNYYGTNAMTLNFKMESATQLRVWGTGRDGSESYNVVHAVSGAPDAVRLYASALKSGDQRQPYFDQLSISSDPTTYSSTETVHVAGKVILADNLSVKNIIIEGNNKLIVPQGRTLTATTHIYNSAGNGGLTIESNASGSGSLLHYNPLNATIQRYVPGSSLATATRYHLVSVPLATSNNPLSGLFTGSYLFRFDADPGSWVGLGASTTTPLDVSRGYMIWYTGSNITFNFAGLLNNGSFSTLVASTSADRYNLVPNPYPSAIDWDAATGWTKTNLHNAIYIWNRNTGNYATYISGVGTNGGTQYIAPGQSFFVRSSAASAGLQMNDDVRLHHSTPFLQPPQPGKTIRLSTANSEGSDETIIRFLAGATDGFDFDYDAEKLAGQAVAPQLASLIESGQMMSINTFDDGFKQLAIPVSFASQTTGEYELSSFLSGDLLNKYVVLLEDLHTGSLHQLSDSAAAYSFTHDAGNPALRFMLHLTGITHLDEPANAETRIWNYGQRIYIHHAKPGETLRIRLLDAGGRILLEQQSNSPTLSLEPKAPKGLLIVEVAGKKGITRKKLIF